MGGSSNSAGIGKRGGKGDSGKALKITSSTGKTISFKKGDSKDVLRLGGWEKGRVTKVTNKEVTILRSGKEYSYKKAHLFNLFSAGMIK